MESSAGKRLALVPRAVAALKGSRVEGYGLNPALIVLLGLRPGTETPAGLSFSGGDKDESSIRGISETLKDG